MAGRYYVEDVVASVSEASSQRERVEVIRQLAQQLPSNQVYGEPVSPELAREMRAAVVEQLRDETLPALDLHDALELLDVLAEHHWHELEAMRPVLARAHRDRPAPPAGPPSLLTDEERVERLVAEGRLAEARALCLEIAEQHLHDEQSCMRVGDFGQATKAERAKLAWIERMKALL